MKATSEIKKLFVIVLTLGALANAVFAEETVGEKTEATVNNAKRAVKKTAHKVEEAVVCAKDDLKCAQKKAANRTKEAAQYVKDKAKEIKNKIDSDTK